MVIRFNYTVLITLLCATFSTHTMEKIEKEESHTEYMIVMANGLAEDYQELTNVFSEGEAPSLQALAKFPSYKLDRGEEVFESFVLIRELLRNKHGQESHINLPTSSSSTSNLGIKLIFKSAVPVSTFSKQFDGLDKGHPRLPIIIAGKTAIIAYQQKLTQQYGGDFKPGTSHPHPKYPLAPWAPVP